MCAAWWKDWGLWAWGAIGWPVIASAGEDFAVVRHAEATASVALQVAGASTLA